MFASKLRKLVDFKVNAVHSNNHYYFISIERRDNIHIHY